MAVIAFLIVFSMIIYPWAPPKTEGEECMVGEPPDQEETFQAASVIDPDPTTGAEYVLIRKNVGVGVEFDIHVQLVTADFKPGYDLYAPDSDMSKETSRAAYHMRAEGIVFLVKKDSTTKVMANWIDYKHGEDYGEQEVKFADVYQDKKVNDSLSVGLREYRDAAELFECYIVETGSTYNSITVPDQEVSALKDQLQLEWFLMKRGNVWGVHCKPAVYLYPQRKQMVNVKVFPRGELSYTDPPYNPSKGWTVEAYPEGNLYQVLGSKYYAEIPSGYLYYESKILDSEIKKPSKGWSVRKEDMEGLFNRVLPELGLNEKEKEDFMDYWLNKLPESPYYFVGLMDKDQRDYLEPLSVTPEPETSIRFSLYFEPLNQPIIVPEPEVETPNREGFTLVDWGGMIKLHPNTPFTCSQ